MKYEKERKFVKEGMNQLNKEIIVSRIKILEVSEKFGKLSDVLYEDRFGKQFKIWKTEEGKFILKEINKERWIIWLKLMEWKLK